MKTLTKENHRCDWFRMSHEGCHNFTKMSAKRQQNLLNATNIGCLRQHLLSPVWTRYTAKQSLYIVYEFFERPLIRNCLSFYQKILCSYKIGYLCLKQNPLQHLYCLRLLFVLATEHNLLRMFFLNI